MKTEDAILQMFYGKRGIHEFIRPTAKHAKLVDNLIKSETALMEKLSAFPELTALHKKFIEDLNEMFSEELDTHYVEGFRFGCLIGIDVMKTPEN